MRVTITVLLLLRWVVVLGPDEQAGVLEIDVIIA